MAIFPGERVLAGFIGAKDDGIIGDNWSYKTCKAAVSAKSHMLSASQRQPPLQFLLHVSAVDRRQIWSMDKSSRCVTLSGFLHNHIVRCR